MKCPFCVSELDEAALVCRICRRDIYLYKPLLTKITLLESTLHEVESAAYPQKIEALEAALKNTQHLSPPMHVIPVASGFDLLAHASLLLLLLLISHALLVLVLDVHLAYLRGISIMIPLLVGFYLSKVKSISLAAGLTISILVALTAVLGMSSATSIVDKTPVLPQNFFEVKEFAQYACSICFGLLAGMVFGGVLGRRNKNIPNTASPISTGFSGNRLLSRVAGSAQQLERVQGLMKKIEEFGGSAIGVSSTLLSIYTGLKNVV